MLSLNNHNFILPIFISIEYKYAVGCVVLTIYHYAYFERWNRKYHHLLPLIDSSTFCENAKLLTIVSRVTINNTYDALIIE